MRSINFVCIDSAINNLIKRNCANAYGQGQGSINTESKTANSNNTGVMVQTY